MVAFTPFMCIIKKQNHVYNKETKIEKLCQYAIQIINCVNVTSLTTK
jgi:hypothetical protein